MSFSAFKNLFTFTPSLAGFVGVERERFITDNMGRIVPRAPEVLGILDAAPFTYELSACQLENRVGPCRIEDLRKHLEENERVVKTALAKLGLSDLHTEVGPVDMPLDVYPDPTGRYQRITEGMPVEVLLAACRVIGTHVHVGMPSAKEALRVYNEAVQYWRDLCELGNGSFGERLAIYKKMAPDFEPKPFESWEHYYEVALEKGFAEDPRKCWSLIRLSRHGTIEFRMFGATDSIPRIVEWARQCHGVCVEMPENAW